MAVSTRNPIRSTAHCPSAPTESTTAPPSERRDHVGEAPDRGRQRPHEAPERPQAHREAPDSGVGHISFLDSDFTRGRSQS